MNKPDLVSLSPSCTEILMELGLEGRLLAASSEAFPQAFSGINLGPTRALDLEKLDRLSPRFIFSSEQENRPDQLRSLKEKKGGVCFKVSTVEDAVQAIEVIGLKTGSEARASSLVESLRAEMSLLSKIPHPQPRVALLLADNPFIAVGGQGYLSDLMTAAGVQNIFGRDQVAETAVEFEDILEARPDFLILAGEPFGFRNEQREKYSIFRDFESTRVILMDGLLLSRFGPRTLQAMKEMRHLFYPTSETLKKNFI